VEGPARLPGATQHTTDDEVSTVPEVRSKLRLARVAAVAALAAVAVGASGGTMSEAACRTPAPARPSDTKAGPARSGPSWTGKPGTYAGAETPSGYLFVDGSTDGVFLTFGGRSGFGSASGHVDTRPGSTPACFEGSG
jgi:hypothetical protein